jgi:hypothetical protein
MRRADQFVAPRAEQRLNTSHIAPNPKAAVLTFEDGDAHHHDRDDHHDLDGLLASLLVIFVDFAIVVCRRSVSP